MFACSYAVTVLRGYDKVVAAITWLPRAPREAAGSAVGWPRAPREAARGKIQPFKKAVSEQRRGKSASMQ